MNPPSFLRPINKKTEELKQEVPSFLRPIKEHQKPGAFYGTRAMLSGATLGLSENIPGLGIDQEERKNASPSDKLGEFLGGFLPLEGAFTVIGKPIAKKTAEWASKSPYGKRVLSSLGKLVGVGTTGAAVNATSEAFKGEVPSIGDMGEHGAQWIALDIALNSLGKASSFTKALLRRSKASGKSTTKIMEELSERIRKEGIDTNDAEKLSEVAFKALEERNYGPHNEIKADQLKIETPEEYLSRQNEHLDKLKDIKPTQQESGDILNKKITESRFKTLDESGIKISEPINPQEIDFYKTLDEAEQQTTTSKLDSVSKRADSNADLGKSIQEDVINTRKTAKAEEKALYDPAKKQAASLVSHPTLSRKAAKQGLIDVSTLSTKPAGYTSVKQNLLDVLQDIGKGYQSIPKQMELAERLNKIIKYELLEPHVSKKLIPVVTALKKDIRNGLKKDAEALLKWEQAEALHARNENVFSNEEILGVRESKNQENIVNLIDSGTSLQKIKNATSKEIHPQIERAVLEKIAESNAKTANDIFREVSKHLSEKSKSIAEDILASKASHPLKSKISSAKNTVVDELSDLVATGKRPSKTLDLWKTDKGRKLVKESLKETINSKEMISYLENQTLKDFSNSLLKENGTIDYKKLKTLLSNTEIRKAIESSGGRESLTFLHDLEKLNKNIEKNISLVEGIRKPGTPEYGKGVIERTKQKNIEKMKPLSEEGLFEKTLLESTNTPKQRGLKKGLQSPTKEKQVGESKIESQKQKNISRKEELEKIAEKEKTPISSKIEEIVEDLDLGPAAKFLLGVSGAVGIGPGKIGGAYMLIRILERPRARAAYRAAAQRTRNPETFILALQALDQAFESTNFSDKSKQK